MRGVTLLWVALPNGVVGPPGERRLRLAVAVAPRLVSDEDGVATTLARFPQLVSWPLAVAPGSLTLTVETDTGANLTADIVSPPPQPELWAALFSASTPVEPHRIDDLTGTPVTTYANAKLARSLRDGYASSWAASPVALPGPRTIQAAFPALHAALLATASPLAQTLDLAALHDGQLLDMHAALSEAILGARTEAALGQRIADATLVAAEISRRNPLGFTPTIADTGSDASRFAQLLAFHRPPAAAPAPAGPAAVAQPVLDFHRALSMLSDYPSLLRLLGLTFDLELPVDSLPPAPLGQPGGHSVRVAPSFASALAAEPPVVHYQPRTAYAFDADAIFTAGSSSTGPATVGGLLDLQAGDAYDLVQIDVDGAALKTLNTVATHLGSASDPSADAGGLPALRTTGISLSHGGRGQALYDRFANALSNDGLIQPEAGDPITLYDLDISRGLRIDVFDEQSATWHSLHERSGTVTFPAAAGGPIVLPITDEGVSQAAVVDYRAPGSTTRSGPLYVHESLAHWQGWSLSAVRPGRPIGDGGPEDVQNAPAPGGFQLQAALGAAPGSLPRLRYGRSYAFRARLVDFAGNSMTASQATELLALLASLGQPSPQLPPPGALFRYRRFEPIPAPAVVARERPSEGESIERLVIRSSLTETSAECADRLMKLTASNRPTLYTAVNERHLATPKTSHAIAELAGFFDAAIGTAAAVDQSYNLSRRASKGFNDTSVLDPLTGAETPIPDTTGIDPQTGQTITRPSVELVKIGDRPTVLHHEPQLRIPYLPDPHAAGVALFGLPGLQPTQAAVLGADGSLVIGDTPLGQTSSFPPGTLSAIGSLTQIGFSGTWPDLQPLRLQLAEPAAGSVAPRPPSWDDAERVLTVYLPKGETADIRVSSFIDRSLLDDLGGWQWLVDWRNSGGFPPPDAAAELIAASGATWMLTPSRSLTLVHAVQQPVIAPQLTDVLVPREPGSSFTYFGGKASIHGQSTAKVDLLARWQETIDRADEAAPRVDEASAHVFEVPVHLPGDEASSPDTGYVPIADYDDSTGTLTFNVPDPTSIAGVSVPHPEPGGNGGGEGPPIYLSRHEFGDTKHRTVRYQLVATSRYRDYFPLEIREQASELTTVGAEVELEVPSTARPAAPRIVETIPTFAWTRSSSLFGIRERRATGVRVYLDRPWFSSGDGELLAVVLAGAGAYPPDPMLQPDVTTWGNDPIWSGPALATAPGPLAFPDAIAVANTLALADRPQTWVTAAAHAVEFDPERGLWYSDITIEPGAVYAPFVRLALARYQKSSLPDLELSRTVRADGFQLFPPRRVTVSPDSDGDPNRLALRVDGLAYFASAWPTPPAPDTLPPDAFAITGLDPEPPLIEVTVEQRIPGTTDELGWRATPAEQPLLVQTAAAVPASGQADPAQPLWDGTISLPADRAPGQYRITIREREHLLDDTVRTFTYKQYVDDGGEGPPGGGHRGIVTTTSSYAPGSGRITFAETIDLSPLPEASPSPYAPSADEA